MIVMVAMKQFKLLASILLVVAPWSGLAQEATNSAESTFKYLANTLQVYRTTGRIAVNLGLDGADYEHFLEIIETAYQTFSKDFSSESAMCKFYLDPENFRMTIEERAELSFSFLGDLELKAEQYAQIDEDFLNLIEREFGTILQEDLIAAKQQAVSNQRLPSSGFDEAAVINFADTACI